MHRHLGLRLAALLLWPAWICGCTSGTNAPSGDSGAATKPRVAFVTNNSYEFWTFAKRGTEKAAQEFDCQVEFQMPARGQAEEQRQIVEDLIARGIQGIAISPLDAANQAGFFDTIAAQVPLVTQDSDLPAGSKRLCFVGTNNYEAGRAAGELVKEARPDGAKIIVFVGRMDAQNAIERRQGVLDVLAGKEDAKESDLGKYTLLETLTDDGDQAKCKANAEDALTKHQSETAELCLVGLWAYNPPAMLAAVQEAGLAGKVAIVAFDENEETLAGVKSGDIHGTIVQQPFQFGYEAVRILQAVARGDRSVVDASGIHYIPHKVVKSGNVDDFVAELARLKQGA